MASYRELIERLVVARRFGVQLGLDRMRALAARLGDPSLGRVVHVGGTNGKGSTVAMVAAILRAAGQRVATYTSPHLSTLRERVQIDGALQSEAAWVAAAARVTAAGGDELTFFEQVTAIGMDLIGRAGVDATVLEVGLGGRLDATNIVDAPVAVVTGVALDHEAILGDSLEAIAREKAGIWKPGRRAIIGASGEMRVQPLLAELARQAGAHPIAVIGEAEIARVPPVALIGAHQRDNAALAIAAARATGVAISDAAIAHALGSVVHPGRFECIGDVILDGAHNPHGARALARTLGARGLAPVWVAAISADKDARAIVAALAPTVSALVATRYDQDRALAPEAIADLARDLIGDVRTAGDVGSALSAARALGSPVLVAGSLLLVGQARALLTGAPADPVRISDPVATPIGPIGSPR